MKNFSPVIEQLKASLTAEVMKMLAVGLGEQIEVRIKVKAMRAAEPKTS